MGKPLHSSRLPSWQSLQACMSRLLSEKEYDCDDEEEDLADVPDRPRDLHYLRGMYRPFLRCSQNHQHIHHHRCIVAILNDGSTFNMICFRLPRIISKSSGFHFLDYVHNHFYPFHIQHRSAPQWGAGWSPFRQKIIKNFIICQLCLELFTYRTMPNYRWSLSTSHQQYHSFNATMITWWSVCIHIRKLPCNF